MVPDRPCGASSEVRGCAAILKRYAVSVVVSGSHIDQPDPRTGHREEVRHFLEVATGFRSGDSLRPGPGEPKPERRTLIAIEAAELQRLYEADKIGNATRRRIQRELDLEETSLRDRG